MIRSVARRLLIEGAGKKTFGEVSQLFHEVSVVDQGVFLDRNQGIADCDNAADRSEPGACHSLPHSTPNSCPCKLFRVTFAPLLTRNLATGSILRVTAMGLEGCHL